MTNDQLTAKIIEVSESQARAEIEREQILETVKELKEEIKTTKSLTEEVHIMAVNMTNMQKIMQETNERVEELSKKDYNSYVDAKKKIKDSIISGVTGAALTVVFSIITLLVSALQRGGN